MPRLATYLRPLIFFASAAMMGGLVCQQVQASAVQGSIDFGGTVTFDTQSLATASQVTVWNTPLVLQDSGNFASSAPALSAIGQVDQSDNRVRDDEPMLRNAVRRTIPFRQEANIQGNAAITAAPWTFNPSVAIPSAWSINGFTFDLASSTVVTQTPNFLNISGVGTITGNGFDATPAAWSFTSSNANGSTSNTFGFQAEISAIPEPGTWSLLAFGCLVCAGANIFRNRVLTLSCLRRNLKL
jgi:hypothetical protein